jgi:hypothetical protein
MINVNKPHQHTLERQLNQAEEEKKGIRRRRRRKKKKKGHLSFLFFSLFYSPIPAISNYHRR